MPNPPGFSVYALLKLIARIALKVFFRKIHVSGLGSVPRGVPLMVAANHPNTFMDPVLVAAHLKQPVYFLANGSVFKHPAVAWLLGRMHLIPVYRKQDVGGRKPDNAATFAKCFQFLRRKGTLLIFPEGTSEHERRLRPLKTGAARIALGAEAENDFKLGVRILPAGLTYTDPKRFRSEVSLHFSKPIDVCEFAEIYRESPVLAVDQLTDELQKRLAESTVVTTDKEQDFFVAGIEQLYKTRLADEMELPGNPAVENHLITQVIIRAVKHFETHQPERLAQVKIRIQRYASWLERLGLNEQAIRRENTFFHRLGRGLVLFFGLPPYLYGLATNYLPYILPSKLAPLISRDITYRAPLMMTIGVFTFAGFYVLETYCFHQWLRQGWLTVLFAASLPAAGFFAWYWWLLAEDAYQSRSFRRLSTKRESLIRSLLTERTEILQILEQAKTEYLALQQSGV